jgi:hypothetical protein
MRTAEIDCPREERPIRESGPPAQLSTWYMLFPLPVCCTLTVCSQRAGKRMQGILEPRSSRVVKWGSTKGVPERFMSSQHQVHQAAKAPREAFSDLFLYCSLLLCCFSIASLCSTA